jgi:hypothetical protein
MSSFFSSVFYDVTSPRMNFIPGVNPQTPGLISLGPSYGTVLRRCCDMNVGSYLE